MRLLWTVQLHLVSNCLVSRTVSHKLWYCYGLFLIWLRSLLTILCREVWSIICLLWTVQFDLAVFAVVLCPELWDIRCHILCYGLFSLSWLRLVLTVSCTELWSIRYDCYGLFLIWLRYAVDCLMSRTVIHNMWLLWTVQFDLAAFSVDNLGNCVQNCDT